MVAKKRIRKLFIGVLILSATAIIAFFVAAWPEITHVNSGESKSTGVVQNGTLQNGYLMPYSGKNFRYFSLKSYYLMNNAYVHKRVMNTVLDAYKLCEKTCPGINFRVMECSNLHGGKMLLHRTHQNGTSIDFAVPKVRNGKPFTWLDNLGLLHYTLAFNDDGKLIAAPSIEVDFETVAKHILALVEAGKQHGVRVKKVILKIELKDEFFATPSGKKVKALGIYFARALPNLVNNAHDDHVHIDFEIL